MVKFSEDEKHDLKELVGHEGLKPLMRILEALAASAEKELLSKDLKAGSAEEFIILKGRAEGARRLSGKFLAEIERLKSLRDE